MSSITTGLAKKLILNYVSTKIGEKISSTETRGVWFSKEEIQNALNTPVQGIIPNGLRFYFGAYESYDPKGTRPPRYKEEENKITLVIIPTAPRLDENGKVIEHPYRKEELLPFDLLTEPDSAPSYDTFGFKEANDGQICPPPRTII
jgi:hypothetical protein